MTQTRRVLLIEDDAAVLEATGEVLSDEGYLVLAAANGQEALSRVDGRLPDVILLDLMMPVMNGWQFVQEFRKLPGAGAIPLIVLSAGRDVVESAEALGAVDYLIKPFEISELLEKVARAVGRDH
jgi:two-component system, chemotaxis family, chemotaxis protein CheY